MNRRTLLLSTAGAIAATAGGALAWRGSSAAAAASGAFEITRSEAEWRAVLTAEEFLVLRKEATERPFTSDLLNEKRAGTYICAGCDLPLYASKAKYDSRTGWPSFYESLPGAVGTKTDYKLLLPRTEVHCSRCGGHLGHIFNDGPPPTGKRHCINGIALDFIAEQA